MGSTFRLLRCRELDTKHRSNEASDTRFRWVCMRVRAYVCVRACVRMYVCVYICARACACVRACVHVCVCIPSHSLTSNDRLSAISATLFAAPTCQARIMHTWGEMITFSKPNIGQEHSRQTNQHNHMLTLSASHPRKFSFVSVTNPRNRIATA